MKKLTLALLVACSFSLDAAAADDARTWTYQYLLATARTERELAPITEHIIAERRLHTLPLLDFTAEVLLTRLDDGNFPLQNKLRLIRVLDVAKSPRYTDVLVHVRERSQSGEIDKEARKAISKEKSDAAAYVPGTIDIRAIVEEVEAAALAATPTTEQGKHLAEFTGGTFDELFRWAGKPQQIVSGQTRVTDGFLIHIKVQRITFFYRGLGRVVYGYNDSKGGWLFQAVVADPLAFEHEFSYRDRATQLGMPDTPTLEMMQLVSGYTASMKNVIERNYRRETRPLEFMDTAAEILVSQFHTARDPVTVDMYAWICRLLTMHGGTRYAAILRKVAAESDDAKLSRFAQLPIEPGGEAPAVAYLPGTVSLPAQRAKYPVLYPGSTFQSGRL
jgi:hypothetical protein